MYIDGSVRVYLNDLAARKPAPGGGSAAALNAAIGAGLLSMVANYTDGAEAVLKKTEEARKRLQALIDADIEAYGKLSKAMKECKDPAKLDASYREAAKPPYEVCKISAECLKLCEELADRGNKNLITDVAIAAICLEGAFFAAKFNVYINLKYIKDMDFIGEIHKTLQPLEEELPKLKEGILEKCEDVIAK
ncbi:MAG: cyclodeaminase/cyclohydrolase family protein [Candidatus Omnitrophica bacterium]|nr:cyclodeaminase/cyclohydrolase family protein [Candidatus Omnitrophota bacterium]